MVNVSEIIMLKEVSVEHFQFTVLDYMIFALMLMLSAFVGIYYGFISKKKQDNTEEYLLGGKSMSIIPVSASLIVSHVSGVTMLALPADVYANGSQYIAFVIPTIVVAFALIHVYLPVFYDLQVTSCFTYLERRFDRRVRVTASLVFALSCLLFIPIVVYIPALAFSQVSQINLHFITMITCVVCIFYTTVGGLKAVVWTDTIQFVSIIGGIIPVIWIGLQKAGGASEIWDAINRGHRLVVFNMNPDPFVRMTFWSVSIGMSVMWLSNLGVNQGCIQRFLAVPNLKKAQKAVWIFAAGIIFIKMTSIIIGFLMYAHYETCDPVSIGVVKKLDQMLPHYVMAVIGTIPGLSGLFIAGIFSAALSSMSTSLNTLSGTIYEDFIRQMIPNASEKTASSIMKILVIVLGITTVGLVLVVEKLGAIMHLAYSLQGFTAGTLLGIFTIGMISRKVNTQGVIAGSVCSLLVVGVIVVGAQSTVKPPALPFRVDGCTGEFSNATRPIATAASYNDVHWIFRISFLYYAVIGVSVLFLVAYPVSCFTHVENVLDERLFAPFMRIKESSKIVDEDRKNIKYNAVNLELVDISKDIQDCKD